LKRKDGRVIPVHGEQMDVALKKHEQDIVKAAREFAQKEFPNVDQDF
jgi:hypothetical protein